MANQKNQDYDVCKNGKMPPWDTYVVVGAVIAVTLFLTLWGTCNSRSRDRFSVLIEPPYSTTLKALGDGICSGLSDMMGNKALCDSIRKVLCDAMAPTHRPLPADSEVVVQVFRGSTNGISFIKDGKGSSHFMISLAFFLFPLAVLVIWYAGFVYVKDRLRVHDRNVALWREICERRDIRENEMPMESLISQLKKRLFNEEAESDMKESRYYLRKALQKYDKQEKEIENEKKVKEMVVVLCKELKKKVDVSKLEENVNQLCAELEKLKGENRWKEKALRLCEELKMVDVSNLKENIHPLCDELEKMKDEDRWKESALRLCKELQEKVGIDRLKEKVDQLCKELEKLKNKNGLKGKVVELCNKLEAENDVGKLKNIADELYNTLKDWEKDKQGQNEEPC